MHCDNSSRLLRVSVDGIAAGRWSTRIEISINAQEELVTSSTSVLKSAWLPALSLLINCKELFFIEKVRDQPNSDLMSKAHVTIKAFAKPVSPTNLLWTRVIYYHVILIPRFDFTSLP